jgi:hypothetical protein
MILTWFFRLQTPVYALHPVPTIVCTAILLTTRKLQLSLPESWWELFDAQWEDMESIMAQVTQLYQRHSPQDQLRVMGLLTKQDVRRWLEEHRP